MPSHAVIKLKTEELCKAIRETPSNICKINQLLQEGADPCPRDWVSEATPLNKAILTNQPAIVEALITAIRQQPYNPNYQKEMIHLALSFACTRIWAYILTVTPEMREIIAYLFAQYEQIVQEIREDTRYKGRLKRSIDKFFNNRAPGLFNKRNILFDFTLLNDVELLEKALALGENPEQEDTTGYKIIDYAVMWDHEDIVAALLSHRKQALSQKQLDELINLAFKKDHQSFKVLKYLFHYATKHKLSLPNEDEIIVHLSKTNNSVNLDQFIKFLLVYGINPIRLLGMLLDPKNCLSQNFDTFKMAFSSLLTDICTSLLQENDSLTPKQIIGILRQKNSEIGNIVDNVFTEQWLCDLTEVSANEARLMLWLYQKPQGVIEELESGKRVLPAQFLKAQVPLTTEEQNLEDEFAPVPIEHGNFTIKPPIIPSIFIQQNFFGGKCSYAALFFTYVVFHSDGFYNIKQFKPEEISAAQKETIRFLKMTQRLGVVELQRYVCGLAFGGSRDIPQMQVDEGFRTVARLESPLIKFRPS